MNLEQLSNADLIDRFVVASEGEDPGPAAADAVGDIENAEEDMESTLVKKARKILIKYIQKKEYGEDADTDNEDEDEDQNGGRRRRKTRKNKKGRGKKSRRSRRSRRSRKTRRSRKNRR
jgi:hypothetical protein